MNTDPAKIEFTIDSNIRHAINLRTQSAPVSPGKLAHILLNQFAIGAPAEIITWLVDQRGEITNSDMWADFRQAVRNQARVEFAPEMALAEAVRNVVAKR